MKPHVQALVLLVAVVIGLVATAAGAGAVVGAALAAAAAFDIGRHTAGRSGGQLPTAPVPQRSS